MPRHREYYHPATRTFHPYPASALPEPTRVPVVTDRYMEGVRALDAAGTDIGSRVKRREYMARNGYVDADDYRGVWAQAERIRKEGDPADRKARREAVGRIAYEVEKRGRR